MVTVHDIGLFFNVLRVQHHFDLQFVDGRLSLLIAGPFSGVGNPRPAVVIMTIPITVTIVTAGHFVDLRLGVFLARKSLVVLIQFILRGFEAIIQRLALRLLLYV